MGVHIYFLINIIVSEVLPPNRHFFLYSLGAPNLVHLTDLAKSGVRYREIFRRDTRYDN